MHTKAKLTYDDLEQLQDEGKRYELFEGEVYVTASPRWSHQKVVSQLTRRLEDFAKTANVGEVAPGVDVYFSDTTVVAPDIVLVRSERADRITQRYVTGAPDLIVEVLSPSTEYRDRGFKFQHYAFRGVPEYWIVNAEQRFVEVWALRAGKYELSGRFEANDVLQSAQFPDLAIPLAEVWPPETK